MSRSAQPRVVIGADHGGYAMKRALIAKLKSTGFSIKDVGTHSDSPCDYPLYGAKVGRAISQGQADFGFLICKSGAGMGIVANKFPRVRAAVCQSIQSAKHSRQHNNANVLILGASHLTAASAGRIMHAWLTTSFEGGRHARRLKQIEGVEKSLQLKSRKSRNSRKS